MNRIPVSTLFKMFCTSTSAPTDAGFSTGQLCYSSDEKSWYYWDGTDWKKLSVVVPGP